MRWEIFLSVWKKSVLNNIMFQQDESPISYNFIWGFAESNILWKWMAGADLTLGCHVP
jgi:hypothetical protein